MLDFGGAAIVEVLHLPAAEDSALGEQAGEADEFPEQRRCARQGADGELGRAVRADEPRRDRSSVGMLVEVTRERVQCPEFDAGVGVEQQNVFAGRGFDALVVGVGVAEVRVVRDELQVVESAKFVARRVGGGVVYNDDLELFTEVDGVDARLDVSGGVPGDDEDRELQGSADWRIPNS